MGNAAGTNIKSLSIYEKQREFMEEEEVQMSNVPYLSQSICHPVRYACH